MIIFSPAHLICLSLDFTFRATHEHFLCCPRLLFTFVNFALCSFGLSLYMNFYLSPPGKVFVNLQDWSIFYAEFNGILFNSRNICGIFYNWDFIYLALQTLLYDFNYMNVHNRSQHLPGIKVMKCVLLDAFRVHITEIRFFNIAVNKDMILFSVYFALMGWIF